MNFDAKDNGQSNRDGSLMAVYRQPIWRRVAVNALRNHVDRYGHACLEPRTGTQLSGYGFDQLCLVAKACAAPRGQRLFSRQRCCLTGSAYAQGQEKQSSFEHLEYRNGRWSCVERP